MTAIGNATVWAGCYDGRWEGLIVPEAMAHPAKMAYGLLCRIIDHGLERGYFRKGDLLADPFGGIGTGGIVATYNGLRWAGVELEALFVDLARQNFALHAGKWAALGAVPPVILQGDSRHFAEIVGAAEGIVTSPPYAETGSGGNMHSGAVDTKAWSDGRERKMGPSMMHPDGYGVSPGQIGRLPAGSLDAVLTSPPYAESVKGSHGERETAQESRDLRRTEGGSLGQSQRHGGYGASVGNIGNLREGRVDGIATSPPFTQGYQSGGGINKNGYGPDGKDKVGERTYQALGGDRSEANIERAEGDTYWQAVAEVYRQCLLAMKPGGVIAVVVKSYVKAGKLVDLPGQTWELLQRIGFLPLERIRAMLVKEHSTAGLFGKVTKRTERKSFFRRLAEKKGSPAIDWEEVLWLRKGEENV